MSTQPHHRVPQWTTGDRLRKAREEAGLDQQGLADMLGVSRATVSNHEVGVGKRGTGRLLLRAWAQATGVSEDWLRTGVVPDPPGSGGVVIAPQFRSLDQKPPGLWSTRHEVALAS